MSKLSAILTTCTLLPLLHACGTSERPLPEGSQSTDDLNLADDPTADEEVYSWDDPHCLDSVQPGAAPTNVTVTSWATSTPGTSTANIGPILTPQGGIKSDALQANVTARDLYSRRCSSRFSASGCFDDRGHAIGWLPKTQGVAPRFCRANGEYSRDSLERITLTTISYFQQARSAISASLFAGQDTPPVDLKILPRFETLMPSATVSGNGTRGLLVDQVAYFPTMNNSRPFIAVFPRKLKSSNEKIRLWESSFVIAHEMGHHVERTLGLDHFADGGRTLGRMAISEGFADLVAYASGGLQDSAVKNMPCLADRAVSLDTFSDQVSKLIDTALINALEMNEKSKSLALTIHVGAATEACPSPNRVSSHGLGAILAFTVNDLMTMTFDALAINTDNRPGELARASKNWLQKTEQSIGKGQAARKDLLAAAKGLEDTVKTYFSAAGVTMTADIQKAFCQRMNLRFAGLGNNSWFNQSACSNP